MRSTVLLLGAGQLGSRYLQGLVGISQSLAITVVDPSRTSLHRAAERWVEVGGGESMHEICWLNGVDSLPKSIDIAIVSTSADVRLGVVENVQKQTCVRYWVLEKVLAQSVGQLDMLFALLVNSAGCWVNTPRRLMAWHRELGTLVQSGPMNVHKQTGAWGLACNAIHFIDWVAWWTGEKLVAMDTSKLHTAWFESKRPGFFEIAGKLGAFYSNGSELCLEATEMGDDRGLITFRVGSNKWEVSESAGVAVLPDGSPLYGKLELQSTMTTLLVTDILNHGVCSLPTLEESTEMHRVFLLAMHAHWCGAGNSNDLSLPIT